LIAVNPGGACAAYGAHVPIACLPDASPSIAPDLRTEALRATLARARSLRDGLHRHTAPLRGRHLALLSPVNTPHGPTPMQQAATELGARVAQVRHWHDGGVGALQVQQLGRTLGRLYDAIDCPALPPALLHELQEAAGVPVFDGLDADTHPLRALADLMTLLDHPLSRQRDGRHPLVLRMASPAGIDERSRTFASAALALGVMLMEGDAAGRGLPLPDFIVEPRTPGRWRLLPPDGREDEALGDACRAAHHKAIMQAVLLQAIGQG